MDWFYRRWPLLVCGFLFLAASVGVYWLVDGRNENYALQSVFLGRRYAQYDALIAEAGKRYEVSPSLIKAVVWKESRFQAHMVGADGERGLMQITEGAAQDWARSEKIETFVPTDLFDPKTNIEVGAWYLSKALKRWSAKDDPLPFALAEYNAGRTQVRRWERGSGRAEDFGADDLRAVMDFPSTQRYIHSIASRYNAFLQKGEFGERPTAGRD